MPKFPSIAVERVSVRPAVRPGLTLTPSIAVERVSVRPGRTAGLQPGSQHGQLGAAQPETLFQRLGPSLVASADYS